MSGKSSIRSSLFVLCMGAVATSAILVSNGCSLGTDHVGFHCIPDGGPVEDNPLSCDRGDAGSASQPLSCAARGGECIEMGKADFRQSAVLLWMGAEEEEPTCPERAESEFYRGYADLSVAFECSKCACGPADCILPDGLNADPAQFCQGANPAAYAAPAQWDGSCVSPSVLPAGSFSSVELKPATLAPCAPIGDPIPKAPGFKQGPKSFSNGVSWGKLAKACQGTASGTCDSTAQLCLPSAEPPPPGFRQCVQYTLPVDESALPSCPEAFPDQFVFHAGYKGSVECSACECGPPAGGQCNAAFSAYQDSACVGQQMPLFENVPSSFVQCIDLGAASVALGSMKATWASNQPGACEPTGGVLTGEVKPIDPRLFCCQAPPAPSGK